MNIAHFADNDGDRDGADDGHEDDHQKAFVETRVEAAHGSPREKLMFSFNIPEFMNVA